MIYFENEEKFRLILVFKAHFELYIINVFIHCLFKRLYFYSYLVVDSQEEKLLRSLVNFFILHTIPSTED